MAAPTMRMPCLASAVLIAATVAPRLWGQTGATGIIPPSVLAGSMSGAFASGSRPWIHSSMDGARVATLDSAVRLALRQIVRESSCRELFSDLGSDGALTILKSTYLPVPSHYLEKKRCSHAHAYTYVGGGPVWVCRNFEHLSVDKAATIVIHEALHHAGLSERPADRRAPTSLDITRMVAKRCRLGRAHATPPRGAPP